MNLHVLAQAHPAMFSPSLTTNWSCRSQEWYSYVLIGRVRTPVRDPFSYGIWHGVRHIHCDSMKYDLMLHWITMNRPYPVPYPVWKCLPLREHASSLMCLFNLLHWSTLTYKPIHVNVNPVYLYCWQNKPHVCQNTLAHPIVVLPYWSIWHVLWVLNHKLNHVPPYLCC